MGLDPIPLAYVFDAFPLSLCVWYDLLFLGISILGGVSLLRVPTGVVSITSTLSTLVDFLIALFLVVTDKSSYFI